MVGSLPAMLAATTESLVSPIAVIFLAAALILGGGIFIVAIIKAFTKQTTGWIVAAVVSAIVALIGLFGSIGLAANAVGKIAKAKKEEGGRKKRLSTPDGKVRLEVPGGWKDMPELNEDATIHAGDSIRNLYVVVIENPKSDFEGTLKEFEDLSSGMMIEGLEKVESEQPVKIQAGKFPALQRRFTAATQNIRLVYYSTAVETKTAYCQVLAWTLPSREAEAQPVFEDILQSFTSNDGPPELAGEAPAVKEEAADIQGRIRGIVVEQLGLTPEKVTAEARFVEDLGADSLDIVELVMATEEEFEISIADEDAEKLRTIGELQHYIEAKLSAPAEKE